MKTNRGSSSNFWQEISSVSSEYLLDLAIWRFQEEEKHQCRITGGEIISICRSLQDRDVMIKNKGKCAQVMELNVKKAESTALRFSESAEHYLPDGYREWQKEIMESSQQRIGYLYHDSG